MDYGITRLEINSNKNHTSKSNSKNTVFTINSWNFINNTNKSLYTKLHSRQSVYLPAIDYGILAFF